MSDRVVVAALTRQPPRYSSVIAEMAPRRVSAEDGSSPASFPVEPNMRRLCFLVPNVESAHGVVDDLRGAGISDTNLYVIAREGTPLGDLPDAGAIEASDFYPQLRRGLAMGGAIGVIGGLIAMRVAGAILGGGAVLLFGLIGAGVNGVLSAIAGAAFPNTRFTKFEAAIEAGHVLIAVDAAPDRIADVERIVRARHPEVEIEFLEPRTPTLPG
jgi:hypothetical protein